MKIKAKFKGADGSLGYRNGKNYFLHFMIETNGGLKGQIIVAPLRADGTLDQSYDAPQPCPYASLKAFLNNWQVFE